MLDSENEWTLVHRPDQSGFLRIDVSGETDAASNASAATAIAPDQIVPSMPVPDDFDEYWATAVEGSVDKSANPIISPYSELPSGALSTVEMPTSAGRIYGWMIRPHGEGPFPAAVRFHGAGVYGAPSENMHDWAQAGFLSLSINSHAIPNNEPKEFYDLLREGELANYRTDGREDKNKLYFRGMFIRAFAAVDCATRLPEWNKKIVNVDGHSQGGGQALVAVALNRHATCLSLSCPTHCDHTGPVIGRVAGWPQMVEVDGNGPNMAHATACRYIDGVNFATRISVPTLVTAAFLDPLCPPTGVYAMFNSLRGPKSIRHDIDVAHTYTEEHREAAFKWASAHLH